MQPQHRHRRQAGPESAPVEPRARGGEHARIGADDDAAAVQILAEGDRAEHHAAEGEQVAGDVVPGSAGVRRPKDLALVDHECGLRLSRRNRDAHHRGGAGIGRRRPQAAPDGRRCGRTRGCRPRRKARRHCPGRRRRSTPPALPWPGISGADRPEGVTLIVRLVDTIFGADDQTRGRDPVERERAWNCGSTSAPPPSTFMGIGVRL